MQPSRTTSSRLGAILALSVLAVCPANAVDTETSKETLDLAAVRAQIKAKDFAAARDALFRLAEKHQHADVYNLLGFSLRKTGDYGQALTYYRKALDFDPDHKGAHEYLGELYVETGRPEKAREHLAVLERLCPGGCEEREDLAKAMRDAKMLPSPR